jgi:hypothetical protein
MRATRLGSVALVVALCLCLTGEVADANIKPGRLGIGDSVMLDAKLGLKARGFGIVDAVVSRQFYSAASRVRYWKSVGKLPRSVVIHLGTNGVVVLANCYRAVEAAGHRRVFLVNVKVPRPWRKLDNRRLRRCARRFDNAHLINWFRYSHGHPSWFLDGGFHLTGTGARAYARLISRRVAAFE